MFEALWRGAAYGIVDALLLTAFPAVVAFALLRKDLLGFRRRTLFALVALPLVLIITGIYHMGTNDIGTGRRADRIVRMADGQIVGEEYPA